MTIPTARPNNAPIAIDGKIIPAGICRPKVMDARKKPRTAAKSNRNIVPAVADPVLQRPN